MDIGLSKHIKRNSFLRRIRQIFSREYYYFYIATNGAGTQFFTGITTSLDKLQEQWSALLSETKDMESNKYLCNYVLFSERFKTMQQAILKKKEMDALYRDYGDNQIYSAAEEKSM